MKIYVPMISGCKPLRSLFLSSYVKKNAKSTSRLFSNKVSNQHDPDFDPHEKTHFGYEVVTSTEKTQKVHSIFSNIASKYDLMNDVMSLGTHHLMKDYFMHSLNPMLGTKLLDVAGGTGDIVFRFLEKVKKLEESRQDAASGNSSIDACQSSKEKHHAVVLDINPDMLAICNARAKAMCMEEDVTTVLGTADALPFADDSFDAYTVAFGMRNFTFVDEALVEAHRVLRRGGRFLCMEFSEVQNPILSRLYDAYSTMIPVMGQLVAQNWKSYQYLVESIRQFSNQEEFEQRMKEAGFSLVNHTNIFNGIVAIYSAYKI